MTVRDRSNDGPGREVSAGGVVRRPGELLLVKVRNLQGLVVWTFPKGHLEAGETAEQAAVREVREETGWTCRIKAPLYEARYTFRREGKPVQKSVHWFTMDAVERVGACDPDEILECRWTPMEQAEELIVYESDKHIMELLKNEDGRRGV